MNIKLVDRETTEFFQSAISETMKIREEKGIIRHDMINLLMQAKKGKLSHLKEKDEKASDGFATVKESNLDRTEIKQEWDDEDLSAQAFVFFLAGSQKFILVQIFYYTMKHLHLSGFDTVK